jgi:hypothetical protein
MLDADLYQLRITAYPFKAQEMAAVEIKALRRSTKSSPLDFYYPSHFSAPQSILKTLTEPGQYF